eukprot:m.136048 g.136048  ORF g.136048 m.136048 type:complete len:56 (+) comp13988_c0_seq1:78-245(+)
MSHDITQCGKLVQVYRAQTNQAMNKPHVSLYNETNQETPKIMTRGLDCKHTSKGI